MGMSFTQPPYLQTFQLCRFTNTTLCLKPEVVFPEKAAVLYEEPEPGLLFNFLVQDCESQKSLMYKMSMTKS